MFTLTDDNSNIQYPRVLLAGHSLLDAELTVTQLTSHLFSFELSSYDMELKAIIEATPGTTFDNLLTELSNRYLSKVQEIKEKHISYGYRMH